MLLLKKEVNIQIGQRVYEARKKARLSRDQLAEKLDISTLFLGYIECGRRGMSLDTLRNLCTELGVSSDYILFGLKFTDVPRKNIQLVLETVDEKYLPIVETQLKSLVSALRQAEEMAQDN